MLKDMKIIKCEFCTKQYKGKNAKRNLSKHVIHCIINPNKIPYTCECGKNFITRHQFIGHHSHCKEKESEVIKKCEKCSKSFTRKHTCKKNKKINTSDLKCKFCHIQFDDGRKLGGHITNCVLNPKTKLTREKQLKASIGRTHTQETKDKLSKIRVQYLINNPDKVPYLINHSSKISHPELLFKNALITKKITGWEYNYQQGIYQYDFAFIENKIDVEIDGGTHLTEKVIAIDTRRDKYSNSIGWTVLRFTAKEVKKDMQSCINKLMSILEQNNISKNNLNS